MPQPDDKAFLKEFGGYKPETRSVPVATIRPIIGAETPEAAEARRAEEARRVAEEQRAQRGEKRIVESTTFDQIGKIRTEFLGIPEVKEFRGVTNSTRQIIGLAKGEGSAMGDIGLVFSYMKTLDPGSVVREGEQASAQNAAGVPERIRNYYNQLITGKRLSPEQRADMANTAISIYNTRKIGYDDLANTYRGLMGNLGANPDEQGITLATTLEFDAKPGEQPPATTAQPKDAISVVKSGESFQTEADLAAQRQLQAAWDRGASVDEIIQINSQLGRGPLAPTDIEWLRTHPGQPRSFFTAPTGQPTATQGVIGDVLSTPAGETVGGYMMGAGNAMMYGALDDLAPILGLDAGRVQAAKDYLRKRAPIASMVGEISGGVMGAIPAVRGASAALAGTRLAGAAPLLGEIAYGAGYGAGEAPEGERLTGALIGGGAAGAGGALANRFLPGGPGTFTGMAPEVPAGAVVPDMPPMAGMAPEAPPVAAVAPEVPPMAAQAAPMPAATPESAAELGTVIREASGTGTKAKGAQTKLAEMAQVNPEAKAAAERLGIEVPADVFSDNPQVRAAIGLTRSLAGSEAESAWRTGVSNAVDQADNVMRDFDAQFVEGAVSPGVVSQRVKDSLTKTRSDLNAEASAIYKRVDESVPKQTPVQMDNLFRELTAIAGEVGEGGMTAQEKKLLGLIQSGEAQGGDITYGRLIREKSLIGKALKREESPYGSLDEATLKRLYAALSSDQLDNVGRVGGPELRSELRGANLIYSKERALGERIINAFGRDLEGGIAGKMRAAITGAAKGDPGEFARLMKAVPSDLRKEVVATALTAASRSSRGAEKGGFGFSEFADLYPKLRANPPVYKQIVETLGPKASDTLRDLFEVSKRITEARANVLTTGKANQGLVESLNAEGIIARIMDSTIAKRAVGGAMGFVPGAGLFTPEVMDAMSKGSPDALRAAGKMFSSPEFQSMLTEAATQPEVTERAINRAVSSQGFRNFAKTIGLELKQGRNWLRSAITAGSVQEMGPEGGPPEGAIIVGPTQ